MSLEEELIHTYKQDGVDEAIESGAVITREEHQRQMVERDIENSLRVVKALMKRGDSLEDSISVIPEDHREAVIKIFTEEPFN